MDDSTKSIQFSPFLKTPFENLISFAYTGESKPRVSA